MTSKGFGDDDKLPLAGGTMTGPLRLTGSPPMIIPAGAAAGNVPVSDASGNLTLQPHAFAALLTPTAVKTSSYTLAASDMAVFDTTSGALTGTLPTAPADKTTLGAKIIKSAATVNALTLQLGGSDVINVAGGSQTYTLKLLGQAAVLQYAATPAIWYVYTDDLPLGQLDSRYMTLLASTGTAGYTLVNGTGTILSWTAPNDGALHRVQVRINQIVTSTETGGAIGLGTLSSPNGSTHSPGILAGGSGTGLTQSSTTYFVQANTTITLQQTSALTGGAAILWAELWGS